MVLLKKFINYVWKFYFIILILFHPKITYYIFIFNMFKQFIFSNTIHYWDWINFSILLFFLFFIHTFIFSIRHNCTKIIQTKINTTHYTIRQSKLTKMKRKKMIKRSNLIFQRNNGIIKNLNTKNSQDNLKIF